MHRYADMMKSYGFMDVQLNVEDLTPYGKSDLEVLQDAYHHLAIDPYGGQEANRSRAYSRFLMMPWSGEVHEIPDKETELGKVAGYFQGEFNPEHPQDPVRYIRAIPRAIRRSRLIKALIKHDYRATFWDQEQLSHPIHVGVHMVRLCVSASFPVAISSPNLVHRDGEQFTFAHLIDRKNCTGGGNIIATKESANQKVENLLDKDILKRFELNKPLHSYGVCDKMVSHYVYPLQFMKSQQDFGYRHVLLVDFSAMAQKLDQP